MITIISRIIKVMSIQSESESMLTKTQHSMSKPNQAPGKAQLLICGPIDGIWEVQQLSEKYSVRLAIYCILILVPA